jgi:hypothetical protein
VIVGGYDLHLYCDNDPERPWAPGDLHHYGEFPHQNFGSFEHGWQARAMARRLGWFLDLRRGRALCPKCNPKSKFYVAPSSAEQVSPPIRDDPKTPSRTPHD